jgi:methionine-rich copper-binding protein CopC
VSKRAMKCLVRRSLAKDVSGVGLMTAIALVLMVVVVPRVVLAHAVLVESSPAINATVQGPDLAVRMKFSLRVDGTRSTLLLSLPDGQAKPLAVEKQSAPNTVTTRVTQLNPGKYAIHWQVLATDGHVTRGEIPFNVK